MARERPDRKKRKGRKGRKGKQDGEVGCCVGAMDDCQYYCFHACPLTAINALFLALWRPAPLGRTPADPAAPRPAGRAAAALYGAVRHYRTHVSPTRPACCPYTPSCSTYAVKALHRHGALHGTRLIVGRLLRCNPAAAHRRGHNDPVPPVNG